MSTCSSALVSRLYKDFVFLESQLSTRPVLGASSWFLVSCTVLSDTLFELHLEDGHIEHYVVVRYVPSMDSFAIERES